MKILKRKGFFYLGHSFRKQGKTVYRETYLGKELPQDIESRKEAFLRKCLQEDAFVRLNNIKKNFSREWTKLPLSVKKKLLIDFSIDFTYNTNAIEGSTVTLDETEELIKKRIAPKRPIEDIQETLNHSKVFFDAINSKQGLSISLILGWHREIFGQTKPDIAGIFRDYMIRVGAYVAPDWQDVEKLMKGFIAWCEKSNKLHPVELAARAHYKFEKIHPFGDGNGRIGRLIIAYILKQGSFPLLSIEYKRRKSYYRALEKAENDFLNYFIRRYISYHKRYL